MALNRKTSSSEAEGIYLMQLSCVEWMESPAPERAAGKPDVLPGYAKAMTETSNHSFHSLRITRKHSSRMRTTRLPTLCVLVTATRYQYWWAVIPGPMIYPPPAPKSLDIPIPPRHPPPPGHTSTPLTPGHTKPLDIAPLDIPTPTSDTWWPLLETCPLHC